MADVTINDLTANGSLPLDAELEIQLTGGGLSRKITGQDVKNLSPTADLVTGPASAVDNRIAQFNGTTGKVIEDSGSLVTDFATAAQGALADTALQPGANISELNNDSGYGTGDVDGPASAVNNRLAAFDGTTGKLIKDSGSLTSDFATSAQGALADSAVQPGDNVSDLANDAGYMTDVVDDTTPQLGGPLDLNANPVIARLTASATFAQGEFGVLNTAVNSGPVLSNASAEATATGAVVVATEAILSGVEGNFAIMGYLTGVPNVVAAGEYFLSTTAGEITTTRPTGSGQVVRKVGSGNKTNELVLTPDETVIVLL
jgi:hypothetical protein